MDNARRSSFQAAIAATHRTGFLARPEVVWDMLDEAAIMMECLAADSAEAAQTVASVIRRNAELIAQIGVRDIDIIEISLAS
jgi:hypothetical protein